MNILQDSLGNNLLSYNLKGRADRSFFNAATFLCHVMLICHDDVNIFKKCKQLNFFTLIKWGASLVRAI